MAGRPRPWVQAFIWKRLPLVAAVLAAGVLACGERGRLIFDPPTDGVGPDTNIDDPVTADTRVPAGPQFSLSGRSTDSDGVDTVYFELIGAGEQFTPFVSDEFRDTVRFSIPVSTAGRSGDTLIVLIFATDLLGTRGDTATRRLLIQ